MLLEEPFDRFTVDRPSAEPLPKVLADAHVLIHRGTPVPPRGQLPHKLLENGANRVLPDSLWNVRPVKKTFEHGRSPRKGSEKRHDYAKFRSREASNRTDHSRLLYPPPHDTPHIPQLHIIAMENRSGSPCPTSNSKGCPSAVFGSARLPINARIFAGVSSLCSTSPGAGRLCRILLHPLLQRSRVDPHRPSRSVRPVYASHLDCRPPERVRNPRAPLARPPPILKPPSNLLQGRSTLVRIRCPPEEPRKFRAGGLTIRNKRNILNH